VYQRDTVNTVKENREMKTIEINGKKVTTNFGGNKNGNYPTLPDTMNVTALPFRMTVEEFLEQKVEEGYRKVTFYETATAVRGYHHVYARLWK
jgi:hypothetical protein